MKEYQEKHKNEFSEENLAERQEKHQEYFMEGTRIIFMRDSFENLLDGRNLRMI